jgi:hypothetical protein
MRSEDLVFSGYLQRLQKQINSLSNSRGVNESKVGMEPALFAS